MADHLTLARPIVVEFFGLPGVGKSHATRLLAARLAAAGIATRSAALIINHELSGWRRVLYKCGICGGELVRGPRRAWRLAQTLVRTGQRNRLEVVRLFYNWLVLEGVVRRARTRHAVEVLDEGLFQILWSVGLAGRDGAIGEFTSIISDGAGSSLPMPDVLVVVDAPLEIILERLTVRGSRDSRVDRMNNPERRQALLRGADLLSEVLSEEVGLVGGCFGPALRRLRTDDPQALGADVEALASEVVSLAGDERTVLSRGPKLSQRDFVSSSSRR